MTQELTLDLELSTVSTLLGDQALEAFLHLKEALEEGYLESDDFSVCAYGFLANNDEDQAFELSQQVNLLHGRRKYAPTPMEMLIALHGSGDTKDTSEDLALLYTAIAPYVLPEAVLVAYPL